MLSESRVAKSVAKERPYKLADGGGLYLTITPAGGKLWRYNYRYQGKQKTLSIGQWPVVSLQEARNAVIEAKRRLKEGQDPSAAKQVESQNTFGTVALAWFERRKNEWRESYRGFIWWALQKRILPVFGSRRVDSITPIELDAFIQGLITNGGLTLAHRVKSLCGAVFTDAIFSGLCAVNPAMLMRGRLPRIETAHQKTILEPQEIGQLLRKIDEAHKTTRFSFSVWYAMRMLPLVFVRPGELRLAQWSEISFEDAIWRVPPEKMKMHREHLIPLSRQALKILHEVRGRTGEDVFIFPARKPNTSLCNRAMWDFLGKLGYRETLSPHGFRAMARTLLHERLHFSPDAIEAQLAHRVPDRLGAAYNRAQHLEERIRMMQAWADYLDTLKYT